MECKAGYIGGHGYSALEELGLPKGNRRKCCADTLMVSSRPRAGDGRE